MPPWRESPHVGASVPAFLHSSREIAFAAYLAAHGVMQTLLILQAPALD